MKLPVLWTLAVRNLLEHKRRSLSVGAIMALGLALVVVGNGFLEAATQGLRASYRDKYTGDLFLAAPSRSTVTVFGVEGGANADKLVPLSQFEAIESVLKASPVVEHWSGQNVAGALLLVGEKAQGLVQVLGVDAERYQAEFPHTVTFDEGGFWKPGEPGLIVNASTLASLRKRSGADLRVGDWVNVSLAEVGGKILELPITGIATDSEAEGPLSRVGWCDANSLRLLKGYTLANTPAGTPENLSTPEPTAIFDEAALFSDSVPREAGVSGIDLASIASGGIGRPVAAAADPWAWEIVTLGLKPGVDPDSARASLKSAFSAAGVSVQVQDWLVGAGRSATPVVAMKSAFSVVILVIALVAVFIVMNALLISVSERTAEIGTMRALGGRRRLIRNLILLEVLFLGLVAGVVGLLLAWAVLGLANVVGVPVDTLFLRMLFSSDRVRPVISVPSSLLAWAQMLAVAVLAGWYPAQTALNLSPLKAIQSD
jgi:putative ABC transport system permease protein